jgi:predicted DNA-binding protein YlxM (UPF0122 family)
MTELETTLKYNKLFDLYSSLLSETQKEILEQYFRYNLSLGEIAEERNVSRAAIEDALKKGMKKLDYFESCLKLKEKHENILKITAKLKENLQISNEIEEIERNL